ncbi:MAG: hypothetical protein L7S46_01175, partial [Candidatus Poseidoniaceae archaeon]|nr:hypothetical protein [Candidatus Poseidoniaceae archaeon]
MTSAPYKTWLKRVVHAWMITPYYKQSYTHQHLRNMITDKFSKTTSLLLIATFALAMASTVSAA